MIKYLFEMKQILKWLVLGLIIFCVTINLFALYGDLTFGNGLGDIAILFFLVLTTIGLIILYFATRKKFDSKIYYFIMSTIIVITIVIFILQFTVLRGSE